MHLCGFTAIPGLLWSLIPWLPWLLFIFTVACSPGSNLKHCTDLSPPQSSTESSSLNFPQTPWTVACQVLCPWNSPGQNTGVGCHFLVQGIFPTQQSNPSLPHCRQILHCLSHQGNPNCLLTCAKTIFFNLQTVSGPKILAIGASQLINDLGKWSVHLGAWHLTPSLSNYLYYMGGIDLLIPELGIFQFVQVVLVWDSNIL